MLLSGGLALFLYGLAEVGQHARLAIPSALGPMVAGAAAVALFAWRALRAPNPLIDLRLFRQRGFAAGTAVNLVLGVALFGAGLLLPLYFELLRGRTPVQTGLLMAPQGLGSALLAVVLQHATTARRPGHHRPRPDSHRPTPPPGGLT